MSLNKITVCLTFGENTHEGEVTRAVSKKEFRYRIKWKDDTMTTETLDPINLNNSSSEDCWLIPKETDRLLYTGSIKNKKRKSTAISSSQKSTKKRKVIKEEEEIELTPEQRASQHQKLKQVLLKYTTNKQYNWYKTYAKKAFWLNDKDIANLHGTASWGDWGPATKFSKDDVVMCAVRKYQTVQQWTDVVAKKAAAKKARAAKKGKNISAGTVKKTKSKANHNNMASIRALKAQTQKQTEASGKCPSCSGQASLKCRASDGRRYCKNHCPGCSKHKTNIRRT